MREVKLTFWQWVRIWFKLRAELKQMNGQEKRRIMKLLKLGMRVWEKGTHPVPGPEITTTTLVVLKMLNIIDHPAETLDEQIETVRQLLRLNRTLNKQTRK